MSSCPVCHHFDGNVAPFAFGGCSGGVAAPVWGSYGNGDGQFSGPYGVALDSLGSVYVADQWNHRIQKFSNSGRFLTKWGSYGSGDGQFINPHGVAVDGSGSIYVTDINNHRIQKFSSTGAFLTKWGSAGSGDGQFQLPFSVTVDSSGNIYVTDLGNHRIQKFSSNGTFLTKWGTYGGGNGQFYWPRGVAVDSLGNVYVADTSNHRIQKFNNSGLFLTKWGIFGSGDGQFSAPWGVAMDSLGNVYVGDMSNHRIQKFSNSGLFLTKWGTWGSGSGRFYAPRGVAVDGSGNVYVADTANYRIQVFGVASPDTIPPTISASATKADGSAYVPGSWTNQDVTVHYSCSDTGGSGLASCTGDQTFSVSTVSTTGTATDNAGNSASVSFGPINIDKIPPTITANARKADGSAHATNSWANQDVTVHYTCADSGSGIASCTGDQTFSASIASTTGTATDNAGNSASASFGPINIDKTPPVVAITSPANGAQFIQGETVLASWSVSDTLSGVAATSATTPNGQAVDAATMGVKTYTVTATDRAGNVTTVTNTYTVLSPAQATETLTNTVRGLNLPQGTETSLTSKLDAAVASLQQGQTQAAVNQLGAFVNQVNAQRGKALTNQQADALIQIVQRIIAAVTG
ncbi:MAG: SBBP repeat-containing protein [Chloroflexi bacterium]|nr:SBBP repeat-containing protein [Chloroflexota bacterium]